MQVYQRGSLALQFWIELFEAKRYKNEDGNIIYVFSIYELIHHHHTWCLLVTLVEEAICILHLIYCQAYLI